MMPDITLKQYLASTLPIANWSNQSVVSTQQSDHVTIFTSPGGLAQRVYRTAQPLKQWSVVLHYLDESELAALWSLWEDREGRAKPFRWTNPDDGQTYFVRFGSSTLAVARLNTPTKAWSATFELVQVPDAEINNDEGL